MASYLQNITDIIPETPLFQPNFGFYQQVLQQKAAQYEQGFNQVKTAYDSILNAPLTVQGNIEKRDEYLKQAKEKLKNIASADLSLHQNIDAANSVFSPFWEDQDILYDYSNTKKIQNQIQKAQSLLNSTDPKVREQFWQTGLDYVYQSYQDLQNSKRGDGSISKVRVNNYVPYFDVQGFLNKRAEEEGIKDITISTAAGGYIIKKKNGDDVDPIYKEWAARQLANSPQAMDVFRVQGTVEFNGKVNTLVDGLGISKIQAKEMLADEVLKGRKKQYESLSSNITTITSQLDGEIKGLEQKVKNAGEKASAEDRTALENKQRQLAELEKTRNGYQQLSDKFSDPEYYDKERFGIIHNGESYFAEDKRDQFIKNFARTRALNTSVTLEQDPVMKMNMDFQMDRAKMEQAWAIHNNTMAHDFKKLSAEHGYKLAELEAAERFKSQYGNTSGSGSGSGGYNLGSADQIGTPISRGLNTVGEDNIGAYNRMLETKRGIQDEYLSSGLSIIRTADIDNKIDPRYLEYLDDVLKTGKYTKSKELETIHQNLIKEGLIPSDYKLGGSPSEVFTHLYKRSEKFLTNKGMNQDDFASMSAHVQSADRYNRLKVIEDEAKKQITKDSDLAKIYNNNELISKEAFLKNVTGYRTFNEYARTRSVGASALGAPVGGDNGMRGLAASWQNYEKQYDDLVRRSNEKMGTVMSPFLKTEDAYIAPVFTYNIDDTEKTRLAKNAIIQIASTDNLGSQNPTRDGGNLPINMSVLKKLGADEDEVQNLVSLLKGDPGKLVSLMDLSKIGKNGKASATLRFNAETLQKFYKGSVDTKLSEKTITALASNGLEFQINPKQLTVLQDFSTSFTPTGIDRLVMDKQQVVKAPSFIRELGIDYDIKLDKHRNRYIINTKYKVRGETKTQQDYVPADNSLSAVQAEIQNRLYQAYLLNEAAKKSQ